jgi:hypothetical protein
MLGGRLRLGLLAEHQEVLVDRLVGRELASGAAQVLPSKGGLLGQRTKRCENIGLLQRSGHAALTLKRKNRLGKPGIALGNCGSMASKLFCSIRRSQNCEKCLGHTQGKAAQSHHKAID